MCVVVAMQQPVRGTPAAAIAVGAVCDGARMTRMTRLTRYLALTALAVALVAACTPLSPAPVAPPWVGDSPTHASSWAPTRRNTDGTPVKCWGGLIWAQVCYQQTLKPLTSKPYNLKP